MSKHVERSLLHNVEGPKQIRERLKSQNKTDCTKKPTPLIVKPNSRLQGGSKSTNLENHDAPISSLFHHVSSSVDDTNTVPMKVPITKRPASPPISHSKGRSISPINDSIGQGLKAEHFKDKLSTLKATRLYLVRRPGPRSFLVASDVPPQTYRVTIGKQECSCGKAPHCIHILFIMLRVLRVRENDTLLRNSTLKNYEVESLITNYEERQQNCILYKKKLLKKNFHSSTQSLNKSTNELSIPSRPQSMPDIRSSHEEEEDRCPICLLAMDDGEIIVMCKAGCRNRLHQKCLGFWAAECQRQQESVNCPLCRAIWPLHNISNSKSSGNRKNSQNLSQSSSLSTSPLSINLQSCSISNFSSSLPSSLEVGQQNNRLGPPIKPAVQKCNQVQYLQQHREKVSRWQEVYGLEMVNSLVSSDWVFRERGLCNLHLEVTSVLFQLAGEEHLVPSKYLQLVVSLAYEILAVLAADPVYRVYIACLRCFCSLLTYTLCRTEEDRQQLRKNVDPVIKAILMKCADGNRQVNQLSTTTLLELAKGLSGGFCVGKHTSYQDHDGIGGISFLLNCMLDNGEECDGCSWQWWLGRLSMLDQLMEIFPEEFYLFHHVPKYSKEVGCSRSVFGNKLVHLDRVLAILNFAVQLINHHHLNVKRMARRVFILAARSTAHIPLVFLKVCDMLVTADSDLKSSPELLEQLQKAVSADKTVMYTSVQHPKRHSRNQLSFNQALMLGKLGPDLPCKTFFSTFNSFQLGALGSFRHLQSEMFDCNTTSSGSSKHKEGDAANCLDPLLVPKHSGFLVDLDACNQLEERSCRPSKLQYLWSLSQQQFLAKHVFQSSGIGASSVSSLNACHCGRTYGQNLKSRCVSTNTNSNCPVGNLIDLSSPPAVYTSKPHQKDTTGDKLSHDFVSVNSANPPASDFGENLNSHKSFCWSEDESRLSFQSSLPIIPGLTNVSFDSDNQAGVCSNEDEKINESFSYLEGSQWVRGQLLGTGAFSSCYHARDVMTGTLMAVKQISFCRNAIEEEEVQMLAIRDEIILMMKLDHPNIVRLLGATLQGKHYNMFVEWMPGGSVAALLNAYGPFVETVILRYIKQVLAGVAFLHDNQILHRDLKGANLLIDSTGHHLRIGDFGAAARMASHRTIADEFKGQLLGTIAFMAPEVLRGEGYGRSCDVWSVGCVVIEMATAQPPWDAVNISNDLALLYKIACSKDPPPIPSTVSPVMRAVALHCLQPRSKDRPPAKELIRNSCFTVHC